MEVLWNIVGNNMLEGHIYEISNFIIEEATGDFRPVHFNLRIKFSSSTTVQQIPENVVDIPRHKFEIVQMPDIARNIDTYSTDRTFAIGCLLIISFYYN